MEHVEVEDIGNNESQLVSALKEALFYERERSKELQEILFNTYGAKEVQYSESDKKFESVGGRKNWNQLKHSLELKYKKKDGKS